MTTQPTISGTQLHFRFQPAPKKGFQITKNVLEKHKEARIPHTQNEKTTHISLANYLIFC